MSLSLIVLAAGEGTRMASDRPKVLHEVAGASLLIHAIRSAAPLAPTRTIVVTGHGGESVAAAARAHDPGIAIAVQEEQLGTGHAVAQAAPSLQGGSGDALVLYADTPFLTPGTLARMAEARARHDIVVLGFEAAEPGRYGRLVTEDGALLRIVEWRDADAAERAITLCNSGVVLAPAALLAELVAGLGNDNAAGEYYLTDIVGLARARGLSAGAVICPESETMGVNTRADLATAEAAFQARARAEALEAGVTLVAPETVYFAHDTAIGRDATVEPYVVFGPGVTVESGAHIRAFSHLEGAHVSAGAVVGPYARLRPGAEIGEDARVGNFVEVKEATIGPGAKANHLAYIGDASVGAGANIGAGAITCNYDGASKHRTEIGEGAFVGTNSALVAPVRIGAEAMTAAGSTITSDVPDGALAVARASQSNKPGLAAKLMARNRAARARKREGDT